MLASQPATARETLLMRAMASREEVSAASFILDELGIGQMDSPEELKQKDTARQLRQELREPRGKRATLWRRSRSSRR